MKKIFLLFVFLGACINISAQQTFTAYFDFDIDEANRPSQKKLADWIAENPSAKVLKVYAYTDTVGTPEYNNALSERRAAYALKQLNAAEVEVAPDAEVKGFGEEFDYASNQDENRKVVVIYENPQKEVKAFAKAVQSAKKGDILKLPNLNFYNNSDIILRESQPILMELLQILKDNPGLKIEIQGHICCQEVEQNDVSLRRAVAIYQFLINSGINKDRLTYKSFGSTRPVYPLPEKNEEERVANRRVEIMITDN
ncbi:OmpA family protein [Flavobacterium coralii]|uniref:OmpA family protein n=1 Tax=Flavobacterium coralii TaxID=2838017 RepID=UPI0032B1D115|tara:strand:+ start:6666 stop:7430 length:765 start_codon:yes stop_codon:yes gene_type:complete